jgi:hypothetical protein
LGLGVSSLEHGDERVRQLVAGSGRLGDALGFADQVGL